MKTKIINPNAQATKHTSAPNKEEQSMVRFSKRPKSQITNVVKEKGIEKPFKMDKEFFKKYLHHKTQLDTENPFPYSDVSKSLKEEKAKHMEIAVLERVKAHEKLEKAFPEITTDQVDLLLSTSQKGSLIRKVFMEYPTELGAFLRRMDPESRKEFIDCFKTLPLGYSEIPPSPKGEVTATTRNHEHARALVLLLDPLQTPNAKQEAMGIALQHLTDDQNERTFINQHKEAILTPIIKEKNVAKKLERFKELVQKIGQNKLHLRGL